MKKMPRGQYSYGIKGNTAVKPLKRTTIRKPKKSEEQIRKNNNNRKKLFKKQKQNDRKYMLTVVMVILGLGCVTVAGDSKIYKMQKSVTTLENQISSTVEENEALRVKILKYSSLSNIEESASNGLGMHIPHGDDVVKIDFSNNYFKDVTSNNHTVKKSNNSFLSFLEGIFK